MRSAYSGGQFAYSITFEQWESYNKKMAFKIWHDSKSTSKNFAEYLIAGALKEIVINNK